MRYSKGPEGLTETFVAAYRGDSPFVSVVHSPTGDGVGAIWHVHVKSFKVPFLGMLFDRCEE